MKKKLLNTLLVTIAVVLIASVFAACKPQDPETSETTEQQATEQQATEAPEKEDELFNETGLPIVNQPYTVHIMGIRNAHIEEDYANAPTAQRFEEETGLDIEWELFFEEAWETQKPLIIASGDLPDAFASRTPLTTNDIIEWSAEGYIIPLKELSEKYAPRFHEIMAENQELYKSMVSPDGEFYAFPNYTGIDFGKRVSIWNVRKSILSAVRPDVVYSDHETFELLEDDFTTDEFYEILKDIKSQFASCVPLTGSSVDDLKLIYNAFNCFENTDYVAVQDDKVVTPIGTDEWVEATKYLHKLYSEQLLDQEIFSINWDTFRGKIMQDPAQVGFMFAWSRLIAVADYGDMEDPVGLDWAGMKPLVGPDGEQRLYRIPEGIERRGGFAITTDFERPEILVRFQDYMYSEDNSYQLLLGEYGKRSIKNDDGTLEMIPDSGETGGSAIDSMYFVTAEMNARIKQTAAAQMAIDNGKLQAIPFQTEGIAFPVMFYMPEDSARLSELKADIDAYYNRMKAKFITEGGVEEGLDEMMSELDKIGFQEYLEIYQRNYDFYKTLD